MDVMTHLPPSAVPQHLCRRRLPLERGFSPWLWLSNDFFFDGKWPTKCRLRHKCACADSTCLLYMLRATTATKHAAVCAKVACRMAGLRREHVCRIRGMSFGGCVVSVIVVVQVVSTESVCKWTGMSLHSHIPLPNRCSYPQLIGAAKENSTIERRPIAFLELHIFCGLCNQPIQL